MSMIRQLLERKNRFLILGQDYDHHALNPSNPCQRCYLLDAAARTGNTWSNRSGVYCDDNYKCTKGDVCNGGR